MTTAVSTTPKGPKKPEQTKASIGTLVDHYNSQVEAYNNEIARLIVLNGGKPTEALVAMPIIFSSEQVSKELVIELIRKQNRRLGRTVRRRALELLEQRIKDPKTGLPMTDADGRSIGLKYKEVLGIIQEEFPEASTSVACLRWYVVHLRMDANDLGLPWPDLPQIRPRAKVKAPKLEVAA